jgi:excisionase family DNA binding protein
VSLLTPKQVAELLGVALSTVGRLVDREGMPAVRLCGGGGKRRCLRFRRDQVEKWLAGREERKVAGWSRFQRAGVGDGR